MEYIRSLGTVLSLLEERLQVVGYRDDCFTLGGFPVILRGKKRWRGIEMRVSLSVFVGMNGKARDRPIVSTLFATLLARKHPTSVSSIQHLSSSLNSNKMLTFGGGAPEKQIGFGLWLGPWHHLSSMLSMTLSESSTFDRPCTFRTRAYRAMMLDLICALDLVEQACKTDISKPASDGCHA